MHNHSKCNSKILKDMVNDSGLAFAGKVGLGPFWTLVQDFRQHLRLLLSAQAYISCREDLHEYANARFI
jgi:hypothetical protein